MRVLDMLEEHDRQAFEDLIDKNPDGEEVLAFLSECAASLDTIVAEEVEKFMHESEEYLDTLEDEEEEERTQ
jgi:arsenate reductase-like glutaredoxin family protein